MEGLGAGLTIEIRASRGDTGEVEQIVALQCARNGDDCEAPVRELLERPGVGPRRFAVAVDGERVVSSLCLIPENMRLGGVAFGAGQIEYVATDVDYERRGLVRALIDLAHRWSAEDGRLVEVIAGIRYFYRRFGYEYAVPFPRVWLVGDSAARMPEGWSTRRATVHDAGSILDLQGRALAGIALAVLPGDLAWWQRRLASDIGAPWWVAADGSGAVRGAATVGGGPPGVDGVAMLGAAAVESAAALDALLTVAHGADGRPAVQQRPSVDPLLTARAELHPREYSLYVRVGNPVALLDQLRPALGARLGSSPFAGERGELLVSLYERSILLTYEAGVVASVAAAAGEQDPDGRGGIGVPPDLVATLLFGKHGAAGLAARYEDVALGARAELAEVLFPPLDGDITLA